ncbi:MAG: histidine phosphatase family protein [Alphaproteobacteria bacterium]|nr:histidine phosphatase family protein [Alphaproteobacteria bacterium]
MINKFYMIRHGESIANAAGYASGSIDTPLTDRGRAQAEKARLVLNLLPEPPKLIVHSPLSRARDTARILDAELGLPLREDRLFSEQSFGDWAGKPWKNIREKINKGLTPPHGESWENFTARVRQGFDQLDMLPSSPVLIVTHGGVFHAVLSFHHQKIAHVPNGGLCTFSFDATASCWRVILNEIGDDGMLTTRPIEIFSVIV